MNNLDFFKQYENYKIKTQGIFESLDKKINSGNPELNEALFGLIKGAKEKGAEREKELKIYFNKLLHAPQWQNYKIDTGNGEVEIDSATQDQIEQAWEVLRTEGLDDSFTGTLKQDGDSIIYQKGKGKSMKDDQQSADPDPNQDPNQNPNAQPQNTLPTYQITYDKKSGKYFFGSPERYVSSINNAPSQIQTYDWQKSPLKVLFEDPLKFGLREITFDFKEGIIASARDGFWIGDFAGKFLQADFIGNNFRGQYFSNNENWKSKPTAFISGTFTDNSKTGLLGLNDVKQGNENYAFHLIQLPPNYSVEILTDKQLRHTITCDKRMDISNSNFIYSVNMGYDIDQSSPKNVTLTWETIRSEYDAYKISGKMNSLPDLFSLASDEKIIELRVVELGTPPSFKKKERFDDTKEYIENTSGLRGLKQVSGSQYNRDLKFNITNDSDFENFNKIKGYINSNQFANDLKQASIYLDNKLISLQDIKNKLPYLVNVFTEDVLSEAAVNLANPKKNYGRTTYYSGSSVKNPLTGKKFEEPHEIVEFLNQKYKKEIEANGGKKSNAYNKDYKDLYDKVFGSKSSTPTNTSSSSSSTSPVEAGGMSKEEIAVLKRIENFVKYFVYKIDDGKNTNKVRKYFMDMLKAKVTTHQDPAKSTTAPTPAPTTAPTTAPTPAPTTAPTPAPAIVPAPALVPASALVPAQPTTPVTPTPKKGAPKKGAIGKLKESVVRNEIRKILNDLL
jgi:hypothetical protein